MHLLVFSKRNPNPRSQNGVLDYLPLLYFDHILYTHYFSVARPDLAPDIRHHDEEHPRSEPVPARRGVRDSLLRGQDVRHRERPRRRSVKEIQSR